MGYYSTMTGEITFSPPLNADRCNEANQEQIRLLADPDSEETLFRLRPSEDTQACEACGQTIQGAMLYDGIEVRYDDSIKAYTLEEDVDTLNGLLGERSYSGLIEITGEGGDKHRVLGKEGGLTVWEAEYIWPDGSRDKPRW